MKTIWGQDVIFRVDCVITAWWCSWCGGWCGGWWGGPTVAVVSSWQHQWRLRAVSGYQDSGQRGGWCEISNKRLPASMSTSTDWREIQRADHLHLASGETECVQCGASRQRDIYLEPMSESPQQIQFNSPETLRFWPGSHCHSHSAHLTNFIFTWKLSESPVVPNSNVYCSVWRTTTEQIMDLN